MTCLKSHSWEVEKWDVNPDLQDPRTPQASTAWLLAKPEWWRRHWPSQITASQRVPVSHGAEERSEGCPGEDTLE